MQKEESTVLDNGGKQEEEVGCWVEGGGFADCVRLKKKQRRASSKKSLCFAGERESGGKEQREKANNSSNDESGFGRQTRRGKKKT